MRLLPISTILLVDISVELAKLEISSKLALLTAVVTLKKKGFSWAETDMSLGNPIDILQKLVCHPLKCTSVSRGDALRSPENIDEQLKGIERSDSEAPSLLMRWQELVIGVQVVLIRLASDQLSPLIDNKMTIDID